MRYFILACDYDGTIALHGKVLASTMDALQRFKASGRKLLLVTGRELPDLIRVFPHLDLFDLVVAENGAMIYKPSNQQTTLLGEAAPPEFINLLQSRKVTPLSVGNVIVATWHPNENVVLQTIRDLGLELQVIFNKGAVMVLPPGINKASGLKAALASLGYSPHNTVGVGDAENDHAFLSICECSVAVANALPALKDRCDLVTKADHGGGVEQLIDDILHDDLLVAEKFLTRHSIPLGRTDNNKPVFLPSYGESLLITGSSGSGKSTIATALMEQMAEKEYQYCIIDPEGDYPLTDRTIVVGDAHQPPAIPEIIGILNSSDKNVSVNMLGMALEERPEYFNKLMGKLQEVRSAYGRPHWIVIDEAHHLLPNAKGEAVASVHQLNNVVFITVHADHVAPRALSAVKNVIALGQTPGASLEAFFAATQKNIPSIPGAALPDGKVLYWSARENSGTVLTMQPVVSKSERIRHIRKYAEGELGEDKSFYFRGKNGKLNLRAQNLFLFLQLAEGIDDETWLYHLRNHDYSKWFREAIKDPSLAAEAIALEEEAGLTPLQSKKIIREAVEKRYTLQV